MKVVCQQTILMKYHAFFVIFHKLSCLICYFRKGGNILNSRLLQMIGGA